MKKLIKSNLLLVIFLFVAANGWAMPMTGDKVDMNTSWGSHYGMKILGSADTNSIGTVFNTFCVERNEYFADSHTNFYGGPYRVDSVGTVAYNGGYAGAFAQPDGTIGDPISQISLWLYASYFEGKFADASSLKVQEAIWYAEDEGVGFKSSYDQLVGSTVDFTVTGWNIKVVNIVDWETGAVRQSQLVGEIAPVPEPATMLLFGFGLIGLAGISRKRKR